MGLSLDPHNDQLPVTLIAQLVEHCTGIAQVRARVPFQPELFRLFICYCSSSIQDTIHKWQLFYFCSVIVQISLPSLILEQEFFSI